MQVVQRIRFQDMFGEIIPLMGTDIIIISKVAKHKKLVKGKDKRGGIINNLKQFKTSKIKQVCTIPKIR